MHLPGCSHVFLTASSSSIHSLFPLLALLLLQSTKMSMLEDPTKLSEDEEEESEDQLNMKRYTEARQICMGVGILFFLSVTWGL